MTAAVLTPFDRQPAVELGNRLWRKRVLPVGDVQYKGRVLKFTPEYLRSLAKSFQANAYDQVPFQLADSQNTHTNDPERFRGKILTMQAADDGLWVTVDPTEDGDRVLRQNPMLGVSARIVENYERSDGKFYPAAVQHVLGTLDPRVPSLGGWQSIEFAGPQPGTTIDLTGEDFAGDRTEAGSMPELTDEQKERMGRLLGLPEDQFQALLDTAAAPQLTREDLDQLGIGDDDEGDDGGELTDAELEEILAAADELDKAGLLDAEPQPAAAGAGLANTPQNAAIELAAARAEEAERQISVFQARIDAQDFDAEKRRMADLGIPPFIADLARPLLEGSGRVVQLANGPVDAGQVMRRVLTEFAKTARMLDVGAELGSPMDEPEQQNAEAQRREEIVRDFRQQIGM